MDARAIPVVQTERLVLRGWRAADFEAHAEMCSDPEAQRFLGGPLDREQSWRSLALHVGHWHLRGYGNWALERRSDGRLIGRAGLWNPEGWFGVEVGWKLARGAWGQGYATEAAAAAVAWAWSTLDVERLISVIDPGTRPRWTWQSGWGCDGCGPTPTTEARSSSWPSIARREWPVPGTA